MGGFYSNQEFCFLCGVSSTRNSPFVNLLESAFVLETNLKVSYYFALLISSYLCFSRNSHISPSDISHSNFLLLICSRILIISYINLFLGMQVAHPAHLRSISIIRYAYQVVR